MAKEALIIVDMSNDFVADDGGLTVGQPAQEIVPYIVALAERFLSKNDLVVITMDEHQPNDPHFLRWPPHNVAGTKGQELYGELKEWREKNRDNPNVLYVPKTNYNAFYKTGLAERLRAAGVETVHLCGVATDICVFLTAAGADAEGFNTAVHKNGVATFTKHANTFLEHMKLCFHTEIIDG